MRTLSIGMIGYKFMGKAHSNAYRQVGRFYDLPLKVRMAAICGRDEANVKEACEQFGWEGYDLDYHHMIARPDIDVIDITSSNNMHVQMSIDAAKAGKTVFCEKPLATNLADARRALAAVQEAGVKHMICFNYRAVPAVALAKQLIDEGRIGRVFHWRSVYLQDWIVDPSFPVVWRLQKSVAGSGSHGDLAAHSVDLAHYLIGDIEAVVGDMRTFVKERPVLAETTGGLSAKAGEQMGAVDVDDASVFLARFKSGAVGTFEATRFAPGHKNYNRFEINGEKGSLIFNFERMNELQFFDRTDPPHAQGFRTIMATEGIHPYMGPWWPPGHIIGYEHSFIGTVANLVTAIAQDRMPSPNFVDGVRCQAVLEAATNSVQSGKWEQVPY